MNMCAELFPLNAMLSHCFQNILTLPHGLTKQCFSLKREMVAVDFASQSLYILAISMNSSCFKAINDCERDILLVMWPLDLVNFSNLSVQSYPVEEAMVRLGKLALRGFYSFPS